MHEDALTLVNVWPNIASGTERKDERMHIRAVLKDFDGVIADTPSRVVPRWQWLATRFQLPFTDEMVACILATDRRGPRLISELFQVDTSVASAFYDAFEEIDLTEPAPLYPGTIDALEWSRRKGIVQSIVSARYRKGLDHLLQYHKIDHYFGRVIALEDVPAHKPDPRALRCTLDWLEAQGISKEECIFVGDSSMDYLAAKGAGVTPVIVRTGNGSICLKNHRVPSTHIINSIADLPQWLSCCTSC